MSKLLWLSQSLLYNHFKVAIPLIRSSSLLWAQTSLATFKLLSYYPALTHTSRMYTATCIAKQHMHTHTHKHTLMLHIHTDCSWPPRAACEGEIGCWGVGDRDTGTHLQKHTHLHPAQSNHIAILCNPTHVILYNPTKWQAICFKIRWLYLICSINHLIRSINYLMHSINRIR